MFNHRIRILSSLLIAFIIVNFYGRLSKTPFITPIQADSIKNLLSNIKFDPNSLVKFFTIKFDSKDPELVSRLDDRENSFNLTPSTPAPIITQGNSSSISPTARPLVSKTPTKIPTKSPTATPKPTKPPKPTKVPPPPPITSDLRPGSTLYEIFDEVNKRACFPVALLKAIQYKESGAHFKSSTPALTIKIYNTYGWWKTGAGDPCFGEGYYAQSGTIPPDSINAGSSCGPVYGDPYDQKIMGLMQISEWEQEFVQKLISSQLPKNDRRVLFDNALMFAYISRSRIPGSPPKDCNNWPDDIVKLVAEKHAGNCDYYYTINDESGNYCTEILDLYKQYK